MRRAVGIISTLMMLSISIEATASPGDEPDQRSEAVSKAVERARQVLSDKLAKRFPADGIKLREERGPFQTLVVVAASKGAYPGTGVLRLPLDPTTGVGYGQHGERTFADYAREHGWLAKPPPTAELVRFLNTALLDGIAILDDEPAPRVRHDESKLVVEVVRRYMPSNSGEWIVVEVSGEGPEEVERRPLK